MLPYIAFSVLFYCSLYGEHIYLRQPLIRLLSPHGLGGLPDRHEFIPLFRLGQLIADFAGCTNRKYFMKFRNNQFTWREFVIL